MTTIFGLVDNPCGICKFEFAPSPVQVRTLNPDSVFTEAPVSKLALVPAVSPASAAVAYTRPSTR